MCSSDLRTLDKMRYSEIARTVQDDKKRIRQRLEGFQQAATNAYEETDPSALLSLEEQALQNHTNDKG